MLHYTFTTILTRTLNEQVLHIFGLEWLPCPFVIWGFALDGNLVKSFYIYIKITKVLIFFLKSSCHVIIMLGSRIVLWVDVYCLLFRLSDK